MASKFRLRMSWMHDDIKESILPLVVDLDGTLTKTNLLFELSNRCLTSKFFGFFKIAGWLIQGKKKLKQQLSNIPIDITVLPYNKKLIDWIKIQKIAGRKIIL